MFHGCRKSIFYVKDTGSRVFSEAYFILRDGTAEAVTPRSCDLAAEAERIIKERENTGRKRRRIHTGYLLFLLGVIIGAVGTTSLVLVIS